MNKTSDKKSAAREQLLNTASQLFFSNGFHSIGVDRIASESGVTKMTMYKHFPSKDHLIVEILERSSEMYWEWFESAIQGITEPEQQLEALFKSIFGQHSLSPQSSFCLYQAVAVEYPSPDHMVNQAASRHKKSVVSRLEVICEQARLLSPVSLARQLFVLMEGFCMTARLIGTDSPPADIVQAATVLIQSHHK
ncbi:TetR/AcrR family transcriptional regulator [Paenibacillus nasutitermitis]|uniref:TetR family transcriptional regulator n=1 Tax=Paenibacillus nasutitermitis TaxID=1652958 RepID=A0A916YW88_9BACL|nr:TetR/AcrR family transcriptional regulator [Paenibacillus nasutitermitis]GGD64188.1 TetR family transcriptional regulator [Paenibacillus nasutitermitis]